jgi:hypothetical protein
MRSPLLSVLATFLVCSLCVGQSPKAEAPPRSDPATSRKKSFDAATRNNSLALLNDLLNDEKNVSKILIIKHNSVELKNLLKNISETAGRGAKQLKSLAEKDPGLQLSAIDLPPGEQAVRKSISKAKERELLHTKDAEFEFQLLLTQSEALNYGAHLAFIAAANEPQSSRAQEFSNFSNQLKKLHQQVLAMLRKGH